MNKYKKCETCKNYQSFYVRNAEKMYKTHYGYCRYHGITRIKNDCCDNWNICLDTESYVPIVKNDLEEMRRELQHLLEIFGVSVDENEIRECKSCYEIEYGAKLE